MGQKTLVSFAQIAGNKEPYDNCNIDIQKQSVVEETLDLHEDLRGKNSI